MTFILKDGSTTEDSRLGRLVEFDERSRQYPVHRLLSASQQQKPRSYTWTCPVTLDQGQEGSCFPAGTLIRMANGSHKRIEEINLLDEVATAEGNTGKVLKTFVRKSDSLVKVILRGHNVRTLCTPNHPFLTKRGYVAAEDLTPGDRVAITKYIPDNYSTSISVREVVSDKTRSYEFNSGRTTDKTDETWMGGVRTKLTYLPEKLEKSSNLGRLLGLYAAEGSVDANKVIWTFGLHEEHTYVADTVRLVKEVLGAEARLQFREHNGSINVVLYGKHWRYLFQNLVPGMAKDGSKRLSHWVTSGPSDFLQSIATGWMEGDGHTRRSEMSGSGVCKQLLLDMHAILNGYGYKPCISNRVPSINKYAKTRQHSYQITVPLGNQSYKFIEDDLALWREVVEVIDVSNEDSIWVYNIHVEGDESYVAEGIGVHNCTGHAFAHELAARPYQVKGMTHDFAVNIYWQAQSIDPWPGGSGPGNSSPYYEGTSILSAAKAVQSMGYYGGYSWAFSEPELMLALSWKGPAVLGVTWYESMYETDSKFMIRPGGNVAGGHAILCNGFSEKDQMYRLHNSWGKSYGSNGDCFITRADMAEWMKADGEMLIPENRTLGR